MVNIRLGGVPEHFNIPIHLAIENGDFKKSGVLVDWTTFKGGTGQMTKALREDEIDVCILLTEGIIKDIIDGSNARIISGYVDTPLIWGIHTSTNNDLQHIEDIYDKKYAISRFGSGSHLMSIVQATANDEQIEKNQFVVIRNLDGALTSLGKEETDVFYWEKFTTKPYVENGQLRRIGEFLTPWPCFVLAATGKMINEEPEALRKMLATIQNSCSDFMKSDTYLEEVKSRFNYNDKDIKRWYHATEWATNGWVNNKMLRNVIYNLKVAEIIAEDALIPELVWKINK